MTRRQGLADIATWDQAGYSNVKGIPLATVRPNKLGTLPTLPGLPFAAELLFQRSIAEIRGLPPLLSFLIRSGVGIRPERETRGAEIRQIPGSRGNELSPLSSLPLSLSGARAR